MSNTTSPRDIDQLISEFTLEEKASLCVGSDFWHTAAVERLSVERIMVSDGPHGLRAQMNEADHVGLSGSVPATCFPTASAVGSSWNADLFREVGEALAREARACGVSVVLGPGINMKRSPLCGRNFEYVSEDPWLSGELATAMVQGTQSLGVGTSLKHYAANNQEGDRLRVSAEVDDRTLREIYLPAFERVVTQAQPWTVMCAYNKINGTYASEHHWLLTEVLRDQWGFEGLVVSDWGAVHDRVAALAAGLDLEMPPNHQVSPGAVIAAVRAGTLDEAVLDQSVRRVLRLVEQALPAVAEGGSFDADEHHRIAHRAALQSAVLLKNTGGALPLEPADGATVAVIGEFARTPRFQGAGSSQVNPTRVDVLIDELASRLGSAVSVRFAAGFGLESTEHDQSLLAEAVEVARNADHVLLCLGLPASAESEGFDRTHMDLPANQLALLDALSQHDQLIVILANGSTVTMSTWDDRPAAILECWLAGQAAGSAAADLVLGRANPSGKLAETIPVRLEDNSSFFNFPGDPGVVRYGEGVFIGYRGYDRARQPVSYPFGFGLSYTSFTISDLETAVTGSVAGDDLAVAVTVSVTNTGEVAGAEVVQIYVGDLESTVTRPVRELKAFARVDLAPGESQSVTRTLDARAFAFWSTPRQTWEVEAGQFEIAVGSSSRDLAVSETIEIEAPTYAAPLGPRSTLQEWLADPRGGPLLRRLDIPLVNDPELVRVIGTMPMSTLAGFGNLGVDYATLTRLIDELQTVESG